MKTVPCQSCPNKFGRVVQLEATINGRSRRFTLHSCQSCWRALEAMFDASRQVEWRDLFDTRRNKLFLW